MSSNKERDRMTAEIKREIMAELRDNEKFKQEILANLFGTVKIRRIARPQCLSHASPYFTFPDDILCDVC